MNQQGPKRSFGDAGWRGWEYFLHPLRVTNENGFTLNTANPNSLRSKAFSLATRPYCTLTLPILASLLPQAISGGGNYGRLAAIMIPAYLAFAVMGGLIAEVRTRRDRSARYTVFANEKRQTTDSVILGDAMRLEHSSSGVDRRGSIFSLSSKPVQAFVMSLYALELLTMGMPVIGTVALFLSGFWSHNLRANKILDGEWFATHESPKHMPKETPKAVAPKLAPQLG